MENFRVASFRRLDDENELKQHDDSEEIGSVGEEPTEEQDPNFAGLLRRVEDARMVYKREKADGTFAELWIYNVKNFRDGMIIKRRILSGTDIPEGKHTSPDGSQRCETWTVGNIEMLHVTGLTR